MDVELGGFRGDQNMRGMRGIGKRKTEGLSPLRSYESIEVLIRHANRPRRYVPRVVLPPSAKGGACRTPRPANISCTALPTEARNSSSSDGFSINRAPCLSVTRRSDWARDEVRIAIGTNARLGN